MFLSWIKNDFLYILIYIKSLWQNNIKDPHKDIFYENKWLKLRSNFYEIILEHKKACKSC